ncbi:MAG: hypothetical protein MRZ65_01675 [Lachnospiraceae bacterium]|nr:hypothetical protein [Lachnospiraceae bacterium]
MDLRTCGVASGICQMLWYPGRTESLTVFVRCYGIQDALSAHMGFAIPYAFPGTARGGTK